MIPQMIETVGDVKTLKLDLFVAGCGYESRATHFAHRLKNLATRKLALGFTAQQELQYDANKYWFTTEGFEFYESDDTRYRELIDISMSTAAQGEDALTIGFDISCLNRCRIAHVVDSVRQARRNYVDAYFFYVIAEYTEPSKDTAPTVVVEPVIPQFSGWTSHPDRAPAALIGLGYEPSKALGIIEHLEINKVVWAYLPVGPIPKYLDSVRSANEPLLNLIQSDSRQIAYSVMDPASLFHEMNSLVDVLKTTYNPLLIPFGPKIFALVSLLVATMHEEVGVWRVSASMLEQAVDRIASKHWTALRVRFARTTP